MRLWKIFTAHLTIVCLVGCTSTAKMTALDRSLIRKTITRTATGGAAITMEGNFIHNPTAAVETFHTIAHRELRGRPYRYSYKVDKKQITRQIPAPASTALVPQADLPTRRKKTRRCQACCAPATTSSRGPVK